MSKLNIPRGVKDTWETPPALFHRLDERFGPFDMDAACQPDDYTAMTILSRGGRILIPPDTGGSPRLDGYRAEVLQRISYDGLGSQWSGKVWLNPPYGLALGKWVPKAVHEVERGQAELVCALLPARPGPRWWQENILRNAGPRLSPTAMQAEAHPLLSDLFFLPGRETFVGAPGPANFDLAVVVWRAAP